MPERVPGMARLESVLTPFPDAAVAVSGGVDSMTLAVVAGRVLGEGAEMVHAVSPAVPDSATRRVRAHAGREGWRLRLLDAGEFEDPRYLANPANRCFFCKHNLYSAMADACGGVLLSGTNLDDLDDVRPGLEAARAAEVRHPYVEAGIDKAGVRSIARALELDDLAELPAAPCLSSRVETGIPIRPGILEFVDRAEEAVRAMLDPAVVRARVRAGGIDIELDESSLAALESGADRGLAARIDALAASHDLKGAVEFSAYRRGSAFLDARAHG